MLSLIILNDSFSMTSCNFEFNCQIRCLVALNRSDARDTDIEAIKTTLVESLFSFLVTLGRHRPFLWFSFLV